MNPTNPHIEELCPDKSIRGIIELVQQLKETQQPAVSVEDITRPIIPIGNDAFEVKIINHPAI